MQTKLLGIAMLIGIDQAEEQRVRALMVEAAVTAMVSREDWDAAVEAERVRRPGISCEGIYGMYGIYDLTLRRGLVGMLEQFFQQEEIIYMASSGKCGKRPRVEVMKWANDHVGQCGRMLSNYH